MLAAIGPGRYRATRAPMSSKQVGGQGAHEGAHGTALQLEDPDGVAPAQHLEGLVVVEGDVVDVEPGAGGDLDEVERPLDDDEVAQAQEVHLQQAEVLHPVHLVLGDDGGVSGCRCRARACAGWAGTR